ncbi:hypothetical protein [Sulfuriferula nivalis]|uniref:Uncharacterized protein n=1 Tax=Sulfuriferula nivalis TaxID=2675298 RepID=A0A809RH17_9PROT|nr:hypothetical protein [Sulfuriferula nivalis]BBP01169.1 hypothetical protein SFSGTM_18770 [Sulfuriferula nivalis]
MLNYYRGCNYATKYAIYGTLFGLCFPVLSIILISNFEQTPTIGDFLAAIPLAHNNRLMYVIDMAPVITGILA